jgi:hypothetical protein
MLTISLRFLLLLMLSKGKVSNSAAAWLSFIFPSPINLFFEVKVYPLPLFRSNNVRASFSLSVSFL